MAMDVLRTLRLEGIVRKAGNAVVVFPVGEIDPGVLMRLLLLARGLPERVVLVRPRVAYVPHLPVEQRTRLTTLGPGMQIVDLHYGFNDEPDVPRALSRVDRLALDPSQTRYYVVDDRAAATSVTGLAPWRKLLFVLMSAACMPAAEFFHLPLDATTQIQPYPLRSETR